MNIFPGIVLGLFLAAAVTGCNLQQKPADALSAQGGLLGEPDWVRNGEPVEFDGTQWYPTDEVENLLDSEVYRLGQRRGVDLYLEKTDVRPFARVYIYFGEHRYRAFERRK